MRCDAEVALLVVRGFSAILALYLLLDPAQPPETHPDFVVDVFPFELEGSHGRFQVVQTRQQVRIMGRVRGRLSGWLWG
ncbi:MAG: hypothetical protein ACYSUI_25335 [Planctomycetota bacterium]